MALQGIGLLILGAAGSGKSGLALTLMAHGARLVADDRTLITCDSRHLIAESPAPIRGLIEARGIGLLHAEPAGPVPLALAVDLDRPETERLPPPRHISLIGCDLPLLHGRDTPNLAVALLQLLKAGRQESQ